MKNMIAMVLSLMVIVCTMRPTTAYAADLGQCEHNYDRDIFTSDICTECGQIRPDIDAPYELPFITREDSVVAREEPRQDSNVVMRYDLGTKIQVVARIRNEHNNVWLKLSDGSYMFADRAAFDFDSISSYALNVVNQSSSLVCYPTISLEQGLGIQCSPYQKGKYIAMLEHFSPGSTFDLKKREILGVNTWDYYVYANSMFLDETYTGEDLGNILYGYTCRSVGIPLNLAIRFGGVTESSGFEDTAACLILGDLPRCDDPNDIEMVSLGWNRFSQRNAGGGGRGF